MSHDRDEGGPLILAIRTCWILAIRTCCIARPMPTIGDRRTADQDFWDRIHHQSRGAAFAFGIRLGFHTP